jgi:HlyD family secretion protein
MQQTTATPAANGKGTLPKGTPPRKRFSTRTLAIVVGLAILLAIGIVLYLRSRPPALTALVTAPVQRQTLVAYATATGTVNPQDTISIGSQVSGTIKTLEVDYNSKVHAGQVLARIDPTTLQSALDQAKGLLAQAQAQAVAAGVTAQGSSSSAEAALATARAAAATKAAAGQNVLVADAAVRSADAAVASAKSALALANQTLARSRGLLAQGYVAQSQVDADTAAQIAASGALSSAQVAAAQARLQTVAARSQATASSEQGVAQTAAGSASLSSAAASRSTAAAAQSAVEVAQAHVRSAQLDLDHTIITSPVDGTVISRAVSVGQTVAASFSTPTLFTIAKDLRKMEVDVAVGEPDIGAVKAGQSTDFSVLAYPGQTFHGTISQVRMNATVVSNVVTYTAVVLVDNADGRLRPGMTANSSIHVGQSSENALVVPVAALSWRPAAEARPARVRSTASAAGSASSAPGTSSPRSNPGSSAASPWGNVGSTATGTIAAGSKTRLYVQAAGGALRAVPVTVSLVSGSSAAVAPATEDSLAEGDAVVVSGGKVASTGSSSSSAAALGTTTRVPNVGGARGH